VYDEQCQQLLHGVVTGVHMIKDWFDAKGHKQPDMKILEVGAGTGSITLPILQTLKPHLETSPRFGSYVFTDISPGFFESACELLKDWKGYVEFKRLDIEKCPLQQGFEFASFDVIAASNVSSMFTIIYALSDLNFKVLHATKDIAETLKNCYNMLKPGGKLVLGEITQPTEYMSLIYGTLPRWWLSEDGRVGGPCLTNDQWSSKLVDGKFNGLDFVVDDSTESRNHIISMMVATKPKPPSTPFQEVVIVTGVNASNDVGDLTNILEKELTDLGSIVEVDDTVASTSLDGDGVPKCSGKFVLSLLEVEAPLLSDLSEREFYNLRQLVIQSRGIL
jgi:ubiquinone/menaquinone biosynthesis C-methylase UbiE